MAVTTLVVVVAVAPATRTSDDESGGHTEQPGLESVWHLRPGLPFVGGYADLGPRGQPPTPLPTQASLLQRSKVTVQAQTQCPAAGARPGHLCSCLCRGCWGLNPHST